MVFITTVQSVSTTHALNKQAQWPHDSQTNQGVGCEASGYIEKGPFGMKVQFPIVTKEVLNQNFIRFFSFIIPENFNSNL